MFLRNSASSVHWLSSSIFSVRRLFVCPASVTPPLISTIWCFRPYKTYIFCEDMILATCQCHLCWVAPSLLLSSSPHSSAEWRMKKWKCQRFRELGTQQQWWHVGWMSITSLSSPGDSTTFGLHYKQVKNHRYDHFCHYFFYLQIFRGEHVKMIGTRRHAEVLTNIRWW